MSALNEMQPFWMVYGIGQAGPRHQHATEAGAIQESERLARNNVGVTFVVLEATRAVRRHEFETFDLRTAPSPPGTRIQVDDDIPF